MLQYALLGAGIGAAGGGIGYLLGKFLQRAGLVDEPPNWLGTIGIVLAIFCTKPLGDQLFKPSLAQEMTKLESEESMYAAIRIHEPKAYEQLKAIVEKARSHILTREQARAQLRSVVFPIIGSKIKTASDTQLLNLAALLPDQMEAIGRQSPETCVQFVTTGNADIASYMDGDLKARDNALNFALISEPPAVAPKMLSEAELQSTIGPILQDIAKNSKLDVSAVAQAFDGRGSAEVRCNVLAQFFRRLGRIPDNKGVAALRYLLSKA